MPAAGLWRREDELLVVNSIQTPYYRRVGRSIWMGGQIALLGVALLVGAGCRSAQRCVGADCGGFGDPLQAAVSPISEPSYAACMRIMGRQRRATAEENRATCAGGRGRVWYSAIVINNSHESAEPQCIVHALTPAGRLAFRARLWVGLVEEPYGPVVPAGDRYSFTGYFDERATPIHAYEATCKNLSPTAA